MTLQLDIIIPSFHGAQRLPRLLGSLLEQTAPRESFRAIVVLNGEEDGSRKLLAEFGRQNPELNLVVLRSAPSGAGRARNVGLAAASADYLTFVDDDDTIEEGFVAGALALAKPDHVVLMPLREVDEEHEPSRDSMLRLRSREVSGRTTTFAADPWIAGFNACKILPRAACADVRYDAMMRSGEDVVFFSEFFARHELPVQCAVEATAPGEGNAYTRTVTGHSVSRGRQGFSFSVRERLECIAKLQRIQCVSRESKGAVAELIDAQLSILLDFVRQEGVDKRTLADAVRDAGVVRFPWSDVACREAPPTTLVVSYCFPPYSDPAAAVMAKRLWQLSEPVDVIQAGMSAVRSYDGSLEELVVPWIVRRQEVECEPTFAAWEGIAGFAAQARATALEWNRSRRYTSLYTRALWTGSHVAGVLIKRELPELHWLAEFSDPFLHDSTGRKREGRFVSDRVAGELERSIRDAIARQSGNDAVSDLDWAVITKNHFALSELATLLIANELVFTTANQRHAIVAPYPQWVGQLVQAKSRIASQPTLETPWYEFDDSLRLNPAPGVRIGYFGSFYSNRGMGEILRAYPANELADVEPPQVHLFTSSPVDVLPGTGPQVHIHEPVPFLTFLNLASQFEVLFINDAAGSGAWELNPFLPSKLSDYLGANVELWGHVEEKTNIPRECLAFTSRVGDPGSIADVWRKLAEL